MVDLYIRLVTFCLIHEMDALIYFPMIYSEYHTEESICQFGYLLNYGYRPNEAYKTLSRFDEVDFYGNYEKFHNHFFESSIEDTKLHYSNDWKELRLEVIGRFTMLLPK